MINTTLITTAIIIVVFYSKSLDHTLYLALDLSTDTGEKYFVYKKLLNDDIENHCYKKRTQVETNGNKYKE